MLSNRDVEKWVCKMIGSVRANGVPRRQQGEWKERCLQLVANAVKKTKALGLDSTVLHTLLYDVREVLGSVEEHAVVDEKKLVGALGVDINSAPSYTLRQAAGCLKTAVLRYHEELNTTVQALNISNGKLLRKEKVITYLRKTLWAEVVALREQLYQNETNGSFNTDFFSLIDLAHILSEDQANAVLSKEHELDAWKTRITSEVMAERTKMEQTHIREAASLCQEISDLKSKLSKRTGDASYNTTDITTASVQAALAHAEKEFKTRLAQKDKELTTLQGLLKSKQNVITKQDAELEDVLEEGDMEMERLKSEIAASSKMCRDLEKTAKENEAKRIVAEKGLGAITGKLQAAILERDELQGHIKELNETHAAELDEQKEQYRLLCEELDLLRTKLDEANASIEEMQNQMVDELQARKSLQSEISSLRDELKASVDSAAALKTQLDAAVEQKNELLAEQVNIQKNLQTLEDKVVALNSRLTKTQQSETMLRKNLSEVQRELKVEHTSKSRMEALFKADVEKLQGVIVAKTKDIEEEVAKTQAVRGQLESVEETLRSVKKAYDGFRIEAAAARNKIEKECTAQAEKVSELTQYKQDWEKVIEKNKCEMKTMKVQMTKLESERCAAVKHATELQDTVKAITSEGTLLKIKLQRCEEEIERLQGTMRGLKDRHDSTKRHTAELRKSIEKWQSRRSSRDNSSAMEAFRDAQEKLETQKDDIKAFREYMLRVIKETIVTSIGRNRPSELHAESSSADIVVVVIYNVKHVMAHAVTDMLSLLSEFTGKPAQHDPGRLVAVFPTSLYAAHWALLVTTSYSIKVTITEGDVGPACKGRSVSEAIRLAALLPQNTIACPLEIISKAHLSAYHEDLGMVPVYLVSIKAARLDGGNEDLAVIGTTPHEENAAIVKQSFEKAHRGRTVEVVLMEASPRNLRRFTRVGSASTSSRPGSGCGNRARPSSGNPDTAETRQLEELKALACECSDAFDRSMVQLHLEKIKRITHQAAAAHLTSSSLVAVCSPKLGSGREVQLVPMTWEFATPSKHALTADADIQTEGDRVYSQACLAVREMEFDNSGRIRPATAGGGSGLLAKRRTLAVPAVTTSPYLPVQCSGKNLNAGWKCDVLVAKRDEGFAPSPPSTPSSDNSFVQVREKDAEREVDATLRPREKESDKKMIAPLGRPVSVPRGELAVSGKAANGCNQSCGQINKVVNALASYRPKPAPQKEQQQQQQQQQHQHQQQGSLLALVAKPSLVCQSPQELDHCELIDDCPPALPQTHDYYIDTRPLISYKRPRSAALTPLAIGHGEPVRGVAEQLRKRPDLLKFIETLSQTM
eukprot:TRINITY_DN752_c0_g1_i2.p1 TRINITY_DN752_c0_g1~~TRINITY_DN752_c0_g1_i2.p1  ORF type:complete len:1324 (+),score=409.77 TRINITY_DN752_c0_g1_i2:75-4046(+)